MSQTAPCTDTDIRQDACSAFLAPCRAQKKGVGLFHPHTFFFSSFFLPAGLKTPIVLCTQWVISDPVWHLGSWSQGLLGAVQSPEQHRLLPSHEVWDFAALCRVARGTRSTAAALLCPVATAAVQRASGMGRAER